MSFTDDIKNEVSKIKTESSKEKLSELMAYTRLISKINEDRLDFYTENASVARRIFSLLKNYSLDVIIGEKISRGIYIISINDKYAINDLLYDTRFLDQDKIDGINFGVKNSYFSSDEEIKAFIRASFLSIGTITNPEKSYQLEFNLKNEELALDILNLLNEKNLNSKLMMRKKNYSVYIKGAENISDFLAFIGATQSLFRLENIRVIKDLRNNVNRVVNCETANINKQIKASIGHIDDINYLIEVGKFDDLSDDLKEIASLRLEYEDYSLSEIAEITDGKYNRSAINYRLNKISKEAENLRGMSDERNNSKIIK